MIRLFMKESFDRFVEYRFFRSQKIRDLHRCIYCREENMLKNCFARELVAEGLDTRLKGVLTRSSSCGTPKLQAPAKRALPSGRAIHNHLQLHENCKIRRKLLRALARTPSPTSRYLRVYGLCIAPWTRIEGGWIETSKTSMIDTEEETRFFNTLLSSKYSSENTILHFTPRHLQMSNCRRIQWKQQENKVNKTRIIDEKEFDIQKITGKTFKSLALRESPQFSRNINCE